MNFAHEFFSIIVVRQRSVHPRMDHPLFDDSDEAEEITVLEIHCAVDFKECGHGSCSFLKGETGGRPRAAAGRGRVGPG
jgi:hypothetical protein